MAKIVGGTGEHHESRGWITAILACRRTPPGSELGRQRWPVERTIGWLHSYAAH